MSLHDELRQRMDVVGAICRRYGVREIALFGSALRRNASEAGDVDLLVEFERDAQVGFIALERLRGELSAAIGKTVDLVPKNGLKHAIRDEVLRDAQVLYAT